MDPWLVGRSDVGAQCSRPERSRHQNGVEKILRQVRCLMGKANASIATNDSAPLGGFRKISARYGVPRNAPLAAVEYLLTSIPDGKRAKLFEEREWPRPLSVRLLASA